MSWVESIGKTPGLAFSSVTQVAAWAIEARAVAQEQVEAIGRSLFAHLQAIPGVSFDVATGLQHAVEEALKESLAVAAHGIPKQKDLIENAEKMAEAASKLRALGELLLGISKLLEAGVVLEKGQAISMGFAALAWLADGMEPVAEEFSKKWFVPQRWRTKLASLSDALRKVNVASLSLKEGVEALVAQRPKIAEAFEKAADECDHAADELTKLSLVVRRFADHYPVQ
jgi:hypothetical protein